MKAIPYGAGSWGFPPRFYIFLTLLFGQLEEKVYLCNVFYLYIDSD